MAQVFQVLKCHHCGTFQVQQRKKKNKWQCKMCNAKQSLIKVFGEGVASDCRKHVQKLNILRGSEEQTMTMPTYPPEVYTAVNSDSSNDSPLTNYRKLSIVGEGGRGTSKWTAYTDPVGTDSTDNSDNDDLIYVTEKTELEQVFRRIERGKKNSKKSRLTGFHPVSTTGQPSSSTSTDECCSHQSKQSTYPYSTVSKDIDNVIHAHCNTMTPRKLTSSKSDNYLQDVHGSYRMLDSSGDCNAENINRVSFRSSKSADDLKGVRRRTDIDRDGCDTVSNVVAVNAGKSCSKWSQFLPDSLADSSSHSSDND